MTPPTFAEMCRKFLAKGCFDYSSDLGSSVGVLQLHPTDWTVSQRLPAGWREEENLIAQTFAQWGGGEVHCDTTHCIRRLTRFTLFLLT